MRPLILFTFLIIAFAGKAKTDRIIYKAGDNSGRKILIVKSENGIEDIYYGHHNESLIRFEILFIDILQEYLKVKLPNSQAVWEIKIDWQNDKVVLKLESGEQVNYWLSGTNK